MNSVVVNVALPPADVVVEQPEIGLVRAVRVVYGAWVKGNRARRRQAEAAIAEDPIYAMMRGM